MDLLDVFLLSVLDYMTLEVAYRACVEPQNRVNTHVELHSNKIVSLKIKIQFSRNDAANFSWKLPISKRFN
jgi:hypothetical protein